WHQTDWSPCRPPRDATATPVARLGQARPPSADSPTVAKPRRWLTAIPPARPPGPVPRRARREHGGSIGQIPPGPAGYARPAATVAPGDASQREDRRTPGIGHLPPSEWESCRCPIRH